MAKQVLTEEQKAEALAHVEKSLEARQEYAAKIHRNSFEAWGNDKCISRAMDTAEAMERGSASDAQYRYWLNH